MCASWCLVWPYSVLAPRLNLLNSKYPDVVLDATKDQTVELDIVADGFDAGIHFGEYIEKDMIAVRVSPDHRAGYRRIACILPPSPKPKEPRDLLQHVCINFLHALAGLYRWEFEKGKKELSVGVNGPLMVDDLGLVLRAALDGIGACFRS